MEKINMKRHIIFFFMLLVLISRVFAKDYEHFWYDRYDNSSSIHLEVYSPYEENIDEKATKKLDELEKSLNLNDDLYVSIIGSISEPLFQIYYKRNWPDDSLIIYNKNGEKIYSEEFYEDGMLDYHYQTDLLLEQVFPISTTGFKQKYKVGDRGANGGIIFRVTGGVAYEFSNIRGESSSPSRFVLSEDNERASSNIMSTMIYLFGNRWRIPSSTQLKDIVHFLKKNGLFEAYKTKSLWVSNLNDDGQPQYLSLKDEKLYSFPNTVPVEQQLCSVLFVKRIDLNSDYDTTSRKSSASSNSYSATIDSGKLVLYDKSKQISKIETKSTETTPNFKVGDYIKELDATVFKIDGNNVTLYHWENRSVTYSALGTFCKTYQKDGYSGWRLPTVDEMNYMYTYRIDSGTYWAATAKPEEQWAMDLVSGKWYKDYYNSLNIFVVRTFDVTTINKYFTQPETDSEINGGEETAEKESHEELRHNFKIGNYMRSCGTVFNVVGNKVYVFTQISYYNYTFAEAKDLCKNLTTGGYTDWRLPTAQELNFIYTNREAISTNREAMSVFSYEEYWCSSPGKGGKPQYLYLGNGTWITGTDLTTCSVIAVREFEF